MGKWVVFILLSCALFFEDLHAEEGCSDWIRIEDVAQYGGADWSNVVLMMKGLTLEEAQKVGDSHPEVTYFFYVKGGHMSLRNEASEPALWRVFSRGDAVYFRGTPHWGTAPELADGYLKCSSIQ